jgi:hypothetical protein
LSSPKFPLHRAQADKHRNRRVGSTTEPPSQLPLLFCHRNRRGKQIGTSPPSPRSHSRINSHGDETMQRRGFRSILSFPERLNQEAQRLREEAKKTPHGVERDALLKKARQAETAPYGRMAFVAGIEAARLGSSYERVTLPRVRPGFVGISNRHRSDRSVYVGRLRVSAMTPRCPVCNKLMNEGGRTFECKPCRQILIFFLVTDGSGLWPSAVLSWTPRPPSRRPSRLRLG